jgi:hypothetical protein
MPWVDGKLKMEAKLHVALYLQTLRICISKFQKVRKKILVIANVVYYNGEKSQYKLFQII